MTSRTLTREETVTVLKHLATGKAHHIVATITGVNVKTVQEIGDEHGYPDREKLSAAAASLQVELDAASAPAEHPNAAAIARSAHTRPAAGASTPPAAGPDEQTTRLRALINTAKGIPTKKVQRQLERALDALTTLQQLVDEDIAGRQAREKAEAEKAAARAEVERLKKQLAGAQAKLRGPKPARTPGEAGDGPSAKEIRAWASANGHEVPDRGRIPGDVRAAYDAAHNGDAA